MSKKEICRLGEEKLMNCGMMAKIIAYRGCQDLDVEFSDGYIVYNKSYRNFELGKINNPYAITILGIGSIGNTTIIEINKKNKKSYTLWRNMLRRCYNKKNNNYKNYGGKGVTVCDEWLCYENFEKWYDKNYYELKNEKVQLDKDILIKGNKIYSPNACIFVPKTINNIFTKKQDRDLPEGVYEHHKKYTVYINIKGKHKYIGSYDTIEEAKKHYLEHKKIKLKSILEEYENKIPKEVFEKLKKSFSMPSR